MILEAREGKDQSTMFYLKANTYAPGGSSPQESNRNLPEKNKVQYGNEEN